MYEVEVKIRAPHDRVRERLAELEAERRDRVEQVDTYYDAPHRDFAETDEALRLRRERGETTLVTYKGPLVEAESKTRREAETAVDDGAAMADVLESLGFTPAATVEKERERYDLAGYTVTLDSVAGLGEFVEVETEADAVEAARQGAFDVLRSLGLAPDDQIRTSYLGLLMDNQ